MSDLATANGHAGSAPNSNTSTVKNGHSTKSKLKGVLYTPVGQLAIKCLGTDTGRDVFNKVAACFGLREFWFFSLQAHRIDGNDFTWMSMDLQIKDQEIRKSPDFNLYLKCRFYPDDVDSVHFELTRRLLFCQLKDEIANNATYCPLELHILMTSYALQALYGNYSDRTFHPTLITHIIGHNANPGKLRMTPAQYSDLVIPYYQQRHGMTRGAATECYLRLASDLDLYGSSQSEVRSVTGEEFLVQLDCASIKFFSKNNKIVPKVVFHWGEFRSVAATTSQVTLSFTESDQILRLRVGAVGHARWLVTEILSYQRLYQRWIDSESRELRDIRQHGERLRKESPSTDQSLSKPEADEEMGRFVERTEKGLHQYDKEYKKIYLEHCQAICQTKLSITELARRKEDEKIAYAKYKDCSNARKYYDQQTKLAQHHVATLAKPQSKIQKKVEEKYYAWQEHKNRVLYQEKRLEVIQEAEAESHEKISKYNTNPDLWLFNMDLTALLKDQELVYEFPQNSKARVMPWQDREPVYVTDPNISADLQTITTQLDEARGNANMADLDEQYYGSLAEGHNKYRLYRNILQTGLDARINQVFNWKYD